MTTEAELIAQFEKDKPIYEDWGNLINQEILKGLASILGDGKKVNVFLKIPPTPRIKENESLIEKAFFRPSKHYDDPYNQITDKVGLRYVVLLNEEIKTIEEIITHSDIWDYSKDMDFEEEKRVHPLEFSYQSMHYIIRSKEENSSPSGKIPKGTPCEVQIRTLLQHAHSELTHDTTYKPKMRQLPDVQRLISKSMALIEATGDIFTIVDNQFKEKKAKMNNLLIELIRLYSPIQNVDYQIQANENLLDAIPEKYINEKTIQDLEEYFSKNTWILDRVKEKSSYSFLYRQPIILLFFYLIRQNKNAFRIDCPLPFDKIEPIYTDLGIAVE
jgi:ppGpp synthetase/RelA/SpoT-type nucleotidyltranferase